jgi:hypothetical protein
MQNFQRKRRKDAIMAHYSGDLKINAIKALRTIFDVGLKEAKEAVEANYFYISSFDLSLVQDCCPGFRTGPRTEQGVIHSFGNIDTLGLY